MLITYDLKPAAKIVRLHEQTLVARARRGLIPGASKPGKCWVFLEDGLRQYLLSLSPCRSTVSEKSGTSTSPEKTDAFDAALERMIGRKRRNTTKRARAKSGDRSSSATSRRSLGGMP